MNYEYCDGVTHTIKQGETLYSLSRQYKVPLAILLRANPYIDVYNLKIGDTICVPVKRQGQQGNSSCAGMVCGGMAIMPRESSQDEDTGINMDMGRNMPGDTSVNMDMGRNMPGDTGVNMDMGRNMPGDTSVNMDMGRNMPGDTGVNMDMGRNMPEDTSVNMDMGRNMPGDTGINMDMGRNMPEDTGVNTDMGRNIQENGGMNMHIGRNMYDYGNSMGAMPGTDNNMMDGGSGTADNQEGCWIKYVAQAGDTLQDIYDRSACSKEMFWDKNRADRMYMLPGVAYFILENDVD